MLTAATRVVLIDDPLLRFGGPVIRRVAVGSLTALEYSEIRRASLRASRDILTGGRRLPVSRCPRRLGRRLALPEPCEAI